MKTELKVIGSGQWCNECYEFNYGHASLRSSDRRPTARALLDLDGNFRGNGHVGTRTLCSLRAQGQRSFIPCDGLVSVDEEKDGRKEKRERERIGAVVCRGGG